MDSKHLIVFRMAVIAFKVLVLLHFSTVLAARVDTQSQVCGDDHLGYSNVNGNTYAYINGDLVSKDLFCKIIRHHLPNDCTFESIIGSSYCQLDSESDELNKKQIRKLLRKELTEESNGRDIPQEVKDENLSSVKRVGIAASGVLSLCCVFLCPCFYRKARATSHTVLEKDISMDSVSSAEAISVHDKVPPNPMRVPPSPSRFSNSPKLNRLKSVHLSMNQVVRATRNFSPSLQIGEGGFGTVFKGYLEDGQVVAIKRAKKEHFDNLRTEFSSEVEVLAKIDHRNLVKLLGYVDKGTDCLIITEFVPNGTLREHLDGQHGKILDFNQRLEISIDVAHALTYLHLYTEKQIIHRDVKSSNILLTESMRAKVADFGFARLGPMDSDHTHISTKVKGTVGYLDPEYMKTYQLTAKSDVYSFGILLLEIITGRRPVEIKKPPDERVTVRWAFRKYNEGLVAVLVDPLMEEPVETDVLNKMFALAFECAAPVRSHRPDMKSVGEQLWGIRADYLRSVKKG